MWQQAIDIEEPNAEQTIIYAHCQIEQRHKYQKLKIVFLEEKKWLVGGEGGGAYLSLYIGEALHVNK